MKLASLISCIAGAIFLLVGCSTNDLFDILPSEDNYINFSTQLPATRSTAFEETGPNAYTTIGVFAVDDDLNKWTANSLTSSYWNNKKIERASGSNGWFYSPSRPWNTGKYHTFFAYAPYNAPGLTFTNIAGGGQVKGIPTTEYTVSNVVANQTDLLVAEAQYNLQDTITGSVQLTMRHILTRIRFSARTQHAYATDVTAIQISKVELTGLKNKGTHNLDATEFWTAQATHATVSNTYTLTTANGELNATNLTNTALKEISASDGNLFLMPQVLTENTAKINITVTTIGGSNAGDKTYTFDLIDLLDEFKQGEALHFLLTVPNSANPEPFLINIIHADWNAEHNIDAGIERDPVLYISNETVEVYDGAVACVYFSSNIPPNLDGSYNNIIYIEDQGRIMSNTGAPFRVEDEFYAIAQSDPDRNNITLGYSNAHINNLRYESDGSGLYKGHLDIVQRKTTSAGETPNQGKQPLILKLHVGKIVRDITVQRIVTTEASKQNPTRYVGTFHRHYETGERIVTWHEDENTRWRVEKDYSIGKSDDVDQLQIDTRISPDFRNKQLYSLVARNPEGTRVEQNDNLFGRGRVYFRIGWKTPTNGVTNRYARIKVTLQHHDNNGTPTTTEVHHLYCRQGDTEEQIATATSRYALYNVLTPGEFVRYPSQTGMLYQWNRIMPWSPLGEAAPYGWNKNANDYETDFDYQRSACPDGYVYPSTIQETEMKSVFKAGSATPSARGYYADGYFDRRAITYGGTTSTAKNEHRVNASNIEVAAIGTILFNNGKLGYPTGEARSIFLVSGGYRNVNPAFGPDGGLIANEDHGANHGVHGGYWFDLQGVATADARGALIFKGTTDVDIKDYSKRNAHSIRCVRTKSWLIVFNENGGENGPRNMTIPDKETTIKIPNIKPNNYYRDNYVFKGWTKNKNGSGTIYTAGQTGVNLVLEFDTASIPANRIDLYAKWEITDIINFRTLSVPSNYLHNISVSANDPYANYTTTSNGKSYPEAVTETAALAYLNGTDKAYPMLEFSGIESQTTFAAAYQACLNMEPKGTWRLPRAQEVVLIQKYSPRANEILGDINSGIWTGTNCSTGGYLFSFRNNGRFTSNSTGSMPYRCVRPATP